MEENYFFPEELSTPLELGNLDRYLPLDRRFELSQNKRLVQRSTGAVLFADISGFTQVTDIFISELGPQSGAEELNIQLNRIYGSLIDFIHQYHGDVIGFGGDSITCWFSGDDGRLATSAGLAIQHCMPKIDIISTLKNTRIKIGIKISLAAGLGQRFLVGDKNIQNIEVLAGKLLTKIFVADKLAKSGEVIVDDEISRALGDQLIVCERRKDEKFGFFAVVKDLYPVIPPDPWPTVGKLPARIVRSWILPPIYERLISGQERFFAEFRWCVPLFIKFSEIEFDDDSDAPNKLSTFVKHVQTVLNHYGGHLLQLVLGDKGSYIYSVFGALVANENDIIRCVSAAMDIIDLPQTLKFISSPQIGISSGQMYSGTFGSQDRSFYSVCGGAANVAARLMENAKPGQILVSAEVKLKAETYFDFSDLESRVLLKGISDPVPVFELLQKRNLIKSNVRLPKGKLFGRVGEQAILLKNLKQLQEGKQVVVIIEGEAGMGKSRLIEMLWETAKATNLICLFGTGDSIEQSTIYFAWRRIFAEIFDWDRLSTNTNERKSHIVNFLKSQPLRSITDEMDFDSKLALLASVLPGDFPDTLRIAALPGHARAEATRHLLSNILKTFYSGIRMVLIIDDAQWLDSASWALLQDVVALHTQLFLLLATRPLGESPPSEFQALLKNKQTHILRLKPMEDQEIIPMILQRLGIVTLPQLASSFILEKAEGNPFFGEELAYALRDNNVLAIENGTCLIAHGVSDLADLNFPNTIQELISSRIDHLEPSQELILKVASVIGRAFDFQMLREVIPTSENTSNLNKDLDKLMKLDFIFSEVLSPDPRYAFKHVVIQQVAYSLLLHSQRRELHRRIAEWYEREFVMDLSPYYPILSHHWLNAVEGTSEFAFQPDIWRKALDYSQYAGLKALRNNANAEAIAILSTALRVLKSSLKRHELAQQELDLQVLLAIPLTLTQGWASAEVGNAYHRSHELCIQIGKTPQLFPTLVGVFTYYLVRAQFQEATLLARDNLELALGTIDDSLVMEAEHDQGAVLFYTGNITNAKTHFEKCQKLYEPEKHYPHVFIYGKNAFATASVHLSLIHSIMGFPDLAEKTVDQGIALNKIWPHPFSYSWTLSGKSVIYQMYNRIEEMKPLVQDLIKESQEQGFPNWMAQALTWWGWILVCEGQTDDGIANMEMGVDIWQATGSELLLPYFTYLLADGYFRMGEYGKAREIIDQRLDIMQKNGEMWFTSEILRLQGNLYLAGKFPDVKKAESIFQRGLQLAEEQTARLYELRLTLSLAQLWNSQGRRQDAKALLARKYHWFVEGLSTPILKEAKLFLDSLQ
jgi:class 3 adenylate cyclase/tetratricopeptide (TPR) repeat protein